MVHRLLGSGFRRAPYPAWVEQFHEEQCAGILILPLGHKGQTNPLYTQPPCVPGSHQEVHHCDSPLRALGFGVGLFHGMTFLYAKVDYTGQHLYINIHCSRGCHSTLYCTLVNDDAIGRGVLSSHCLCGSCHTDWFQRGWCCPLMYCPA